MMPMVITKSFGALPISKKEILRYAGCGEANAETLSLLEECLKETGDRLSLKVCYTTLPVKMEGSAVDCSLFAVHSKDLAKNLAGCRRVVVFCATIGMEFDRLIARYSHLSPAKALMLQAIGTERVEALCDAFCRTLESESGISCRPRFSCGYGDLDIETQKKIFSLLQCQKHIGVYLNGSLLMTPTKSVTAFVGVDASDMR